MNTRKAAHWIAVSPSLIRAARLLPELVEIGRHSGRSVADAVLHPRHRPLVAASRDFPIVVTLRWPDDRTPLGAAGVSVVRGNRVWSHATDGKGLSNTGVTRRTSITFGRAR